MVCPKCYANCKKEQVRCYHCGFDLTLLDGATNKGAKEARKSIYKDDIMKFKGIPPDVKKKKLVLLSIFLGIFGAHNFYVGKLWQGLFMCISTTVTLVLSTLVSMFGIVDMYNTLYIAFQFWLIFQGATVLMWVFDIILIFLERWKIPVYRKEFSINATSQSKKK